MTMLRCQHERKRAVKPTGRPFHVELHRGRNSVAISVWKVLVFPLINWPIHIYAAAHNAAPAIHKIRKASKASTKQLHAMCPTTKEMSAIMLSRVSVVLLLRSFACSVALCFPMNTPEVDQAPPFACTEICALDRIGLSSSNPC